MEKVYVQTKCAPDDIGNIVPMCIIWPDKRNFKIDKILHVAEEPIENGECIKYIVSIAGQQKILYHERQGWFVYR